MMKKLFILTISKSSRNEISFHELLVYSATVYAARFKKGLDRRRIANLTGLDRGETVGKTVTNLIERKLLRESEGRLFAVKPPDYLFAARNDNGNWWERFAYFQIGVMKKDCPLTSRANCIYWLKRSFLKNGRKLTNSAVATILGISAKTVQTALKEGIKLGLYTARKQPNCEKLPDYWEQKKEKSTKHAGAIRPLSERFQFPNTILFEDMSDLKTRLNKIEQRFAYYKFTANQVDKLFADLLKQAGGDYRPMEVFIGFCCRNIIQATEEITKANRETRNYSGPNNLVFSESEKCMMKILKQYRKNSDISNWPGFEYTVERYTN